MRKRFIIPICILAVVALLSAFKTAEIVAMYYLERQSYNAVADEFSAESKEKLPINVDFEKIVKKYPDVVGWIYCPDTPLNYPVVQGEDNDYYLRRMVDGSSSACGSIFMDCNNSSDFSDSNTIIYGHNMKDGSMFGCLTKYRNDGFLKKHSVIYLLTPEKEYKINVTDSYTVSADDKETYSITSKNVKTITLSTCSYEFKDARYVVVGALEEL